MDKRSVIVFSGLWLYPISLGVTYFIASQIEGIVRQKMAFGGHLVVWLIALIPSMLILIRNTYDYIFRKKREFTLKNQFFPDANEYSPEKIRAMYPDVPSKYLSSNPEGIILGKHRNKYVRLPVDLNNILHGCIIGAPGSGKSAGPYLSTLITNFMQVNPPMTVFCIDIKPELAFKSVEINGNSKIKVINPTDRSSWGYDVYYQLTDKSTDDEILHVLSDVSRALICSSNPKDSFFINQARTILQASCLHFYRNGMGFVDSICELVSNDLTTLIGQILEDPTTCPKAKAMLKKFAGKTSEAFQDIELTLSEHLNIFLLNEVKWTLRDNPLKARPQDLNEGISLFLSLPETVLEEYKDLFTLITYQVLKAMEARKETSNRQITCILDEFARLNKMPKILDSLATLRSRKISIWLAFQDLNQLISIYGREDAYSILNLCEVTCVLSCKDSQTAKLISDWGGEYRERQANISSDVMWGTNAHESISEQYRKIIQTSDVMSLKQTGEVILFVEGQFFRCKRIRYYEERVLKERYEQLMEKNKPDRKEK